MHDTEQRTPDHELFVKVLAQIERDPLRWNQANWRTVDDCGTAYCFAGWVIALSGIEWAEKWYVVDPATDTPRAASVVAAELLGIPHLTTDGSYNLSDVRDLFDANNTLDDLYRTSASYLGIDETVLRDKVAAEVSP